MNYLRNIISDPVDLLAQIIIGTGETIAVAIFVWNICVWWSITP